MVNKLNDASGEETNLFSLSLYNGKMIFSLKIWQFLGVAKGYNHKMM